MVWIHICSIYSTAWKSKYDIKCVTKYMRVCLLQFLSSEAVCFFLPITYWAACLQIFYARIFSTDWHSGFYRNYSPIFCLLEDVHPAVECSICDHLTALSWCSMLSSAMDLEVGTSWQDRRQPDLAMPKAFIVCCVSCSVSYVAVGLPAAVKDGE